MAARQTAVILERVHRCLHCGSEMTVGALAYAENSYCTSCHDERTALDGGPDAVEWRREGAYVHFLKRGT